MEHPYRVHSSIGFGFLQLLMLSSLAYPSPPPPLYHNIALIRMMGTVYFTMFHEKPFYLKLECATVFLEVIRDTLYVWYVIQDYTYIFGVIDIITNFLFCTVIVLSITNGDDKWEKIAEATEGLRKTCLECWWKKEENNTHEYSRELEGRGKNAAHPPASNAHMYSSLPTHENTTHYHTPVYTMGGRQAFKPSFYSSLWGRDYLDAKVKSEFSQIEHNNTANIGMVTSSDGNTQYIRFDEPESLPTSGAYHYANMFVSPYFAKDGTPITSLAEWTKKDTIGVCLFIYNLIEFIYQLMMYNSIVKSCRTFHSEVSMNTTIEHERWLRWLC